MSVLTTGSPAVSRSDSRDDTRSGARRERRHLRALDDHVRRHPLVFIALYVLIGVAAVMGAVSLNALSVTDAVELSRLEAEVVTAEREWTQAVANVATLEDPARVRLLAEQLGMEPTPQRFLVPSQSLPGDGDPVMIEDPDKPLRSADG